VSEVDDDGHIRFGRSRTTTELLEAALSRFDSVFALDCNLANP